MFEHLETALDEEPLFPVEDWRALENPRRDLSELERQSQFVAFLRKTCPHIAVIAIPNAAKRGLKAQAQARKEGIYAGAFDTHVSWDIAHATADCPATIAWLEWKGFDARGRAGTLSPAQIDFGNRLHKQGHKVACFFSAKSAIEWLRSLGAPIRANFTA